MSWEDTIVDESTNKPIKIKPEKISKNSSWEDTIQESALGQDISTFDKVLNVMDIPSSLIRTGAEAALSPDREVIPSVIEQAKRTIQSPTTAASIAPTGADINKQIFPEFREESLPGMVGSFTTETALDPASWFRPSKSITKPIRKALESASERQAAKAIAKFASKADVLKEGADLDVIGARLVAEDLQGLIRKPVKLYETLTGQRHLQKIANYI